MTGKNSNNNKERISLSELINVSDLRLAGLNSKGKHNIEYFVELRFKVNRKLLSPEAKRCQIDKSVIKLKLHGKDYVLAGIEMTSKDIFAAHMWNFIINSISNKEYLSYMNRVFDGALHIAKKKKLLNHKGLMIAGNYDSINV